MSANIALFEKAKNSDFQKTLEENNTDLMIAMIALLFIETEIAFEELQDYIVKNQDGYFFKCGQNKAPLINFYNALEAKDDQLSWETFKSLLENSENLALFGCSPGTSGTTSSRQPNLSEIDGDDTDDKDDWS